MNGCRRFRECHLMSAGRERLPSDLAQDSTVVHASDEVAPNVRVRYTKPAQGIRVHQ